MSITEAERHEIYESLKNQHGEKVASNLMSMLPPVGWADVATKTDVQSEVHALRTDLHALEAKLEGRMDRLEGRMDVMAADLRTEMHVSIRNQTWALVAWTTGWTTALAGLMLALGR